MSNLARDFDRSKALVWGRLADEQARVADALGRSGYFAQVEQMTANANRLSAEVGAIATTVASLQEQGVAARLTPLLIQKILADNDAAMRRLAIVTAPLIDQIVNQRLDFPALSFEEVRARMVEAPVVARPRRARRKHTRQIDPELVAARERIAQLERQVRSLRLPDQFGDDDYPPMEPDYFGRN